jgi:uncharacterized cupredoxin-like copper-binding protein
MSRSLSHVSRRVAGLAAVAALLLAPLALLATTTADAASTQSVRLTEFKVTPAHHTVAHGRTTFVVRNAGTMEHEMVVIRTTKKASQLGNGSGKASVRGAIGDVQVAAGRTKRLSVTLRAGHYVLLCNIGGHYMAGMRTDLTVH